MSTTLPCPWCGRIPLLQEVGKAALVVGGALANMAFSVVCSNTKACLVHPRTRWCATADEAYAAWNHREPAQEVAV